MRGKILVITIIAAIDSFLVFFAIGFNSKHALVEDPSLPPVDMAQVRKSVEEREAKPPMKSVPKPMVKAEPAAKNIKETKHKSRNKAKKSASKSKHQ